MNSKNIHFLANRVAKQGSSPQSGALQHLDAAHAKLKKLQAWRSQQKLDYLVCADERDTALREVEKFKFYADEKSGELQKSKTLIDVQAKIIKDLRNECSALRRHSKWPERAKSVNSNAPALTARALEKVAEQPGNNKCVEDAASPDLSPGLITSLYRRMRWRMSPG